MLATTLTSMAAPLSPLTRPPANRPMRLDILAHRLIASVVRSYDSKQSIRGSTGLKEQSQGDVETARYRRPLPIVNHCARAQARLQRCSRASQPSKCDNNSMGRNRLYENRQSSEKSDR